MHKEVKTMEEKIIKIMLQEGKPVSFHTVARDLHEQEFIVWDLIDEMLDKGLIKKIPPIPLSESSEPCSNFYVLTKKGISMLNRLSEKVNSARKLKFHTED
jgi:hypothetical protein